VSCFSKCYNGWINESHDSLNEVMVEQNSCTREESILKFINFGTLRCGSKLQMPNLFKMIVTRGLRFNTGEVTFLVMYALLQTGN
jgi:hypothetical protein